MQMALKICVTMLLLGSSYNAMASQHKLASSSVNSTYHSIGVALEAAVSIHLTPTTDIRLTSVSTIDPRESVDLLTTGEVDFASLPSLLGHQARTGTGPLAALGPRRELRAVAMMVPLTYHAFVRKPMVQSGDVKDLLGLPGDRLQFGIGGSDAADVTAFLHRQLGVSADGLDDFSLTRSTTDQSTINEDADGIVATGHLPMPAVDELMATSSEELTFLDVGAEQVARVNDGYDLFTTMIIPPGTYPGQTEAVQTLAVPVFLATRVDVDNEVVYQITKLMFEQSGFLQTIHPAMESLAFETALDNLPFPLHPGAIRYFEEYGLSLAALTDSAPSFTAYGLQADDAEQRRIETNSDVVGLMVDPDSTSTQMAGELATVLNTAPSDIRVLAQRGEGSAQIVNDLLYMKGLDLGVVQADVLDHFRSSEDTAWLPDQLQYLAKLYNREIHILTRSEVTGLSDLAGKAVNFGPSGSASERSAGNIFSHLGVAVQQESEPFAFALDKLKRGDIAAMVVNGGKPLSTLAAIPADSGLKLLDLPLIDGYPYYERARISAADYPNLVAEGEDVNSLSVPAILMTYRWPAASDRFALLSTFFSNFAARFDEFQIDGRFHPKWQEISLEAEFEEWPRSVISSSIEPEPADRPEASLPSAPALPLQAARPRDGPS